VNPCQDVLRQDIYLGLALHYLFSPLALDVNAVDGLLDLDVDGGHDQVDHEALLLGSYVSEQFGHFIY
jgi:hypothetical protein